MSSMPGPIAEEAAMEICGRVRSRIWFTQCWGCIKFSKGDPQKMCFYGPPDNRGCPRINKAYDARI